MITQDVRKYAQEQQELVELGMAEKSNEFREKGGRFICRSWRSSEDIAAG
jgi:hypothetical protein